MAHVPSSQRRRELIEAAITVIATEGAARATTRRIAEEAGAPLASLHYTFADKESLFAAVYEECCRRAEEFFAALDVGSGDPVAAVFDGFVDRIAAQPDAELAQFELLAWAVQSPAGRDLATVVYARYFDVLLTALRRGGVPGDEHARALVRIMVAVIDGLLMQLFSFRDVDRLRTDAALARDALQAQFRRVDR